MYGPASGSESFHDIEKERKRLKKERKELDVNFRHSHRMAVAAELTLAEVAALRLYSGPMFAPMNYALRTENIKDWATTISCCYSAVLKVPCPGCCRCPRAAPS